MGDSQLTFNWVRAFADYIISFNFGKGVHHHSPEASSAIIPYLLRRVWQEDNDQATLLQEIGQYGTISGDIFVKVAWEPPYQDSVGVIHPPKIRILPINPAYCFPTFHPHDRTRLIEFKLKYKFWGQAADGARTMHTYVEVITDEIIREYVDDELIDERANPLGLIPVAFCPNMRVASSPWGVSDIEDLIPLNREYNEKATEISDILNYHCVDTETEALTVDGWKRYEDLAPGDELLCLDPDTDEIRWESASAINVFDHDGPLVKWDNRVDAVTTPNHRWLAERKIGRPANVRYEREFVRTSQAQDGDKAAGDLREGSRIILGGGTPAHFPAEGKYTDEFVETVGWLVTEGWVGLQGTATRPVTILSQSVRENPGHVASIRRLQAYWRNLGATFTEQKERSNGVVCWYLGADVTAELLAAAPEKAITPEFLTSLTFAQAERFHRILIDADGTVSGERDIWYQDNLGRRDGFQMLSAMLSGARTRSFLNSRGDGVVDTYQTRTIDILSTVNRAQEVPNWSGKVWCPTVPTGVWFARRNGVTYWTGNSAPVTVITGAKAQNLEKGPRKVWSISNAGAKVTNLQLETNMAAPLGFLELLKQAMHEMTGVPSGALGQAQPITNTSGAALSMVYLSMIQRRQLKLVTYTKLLKDVNALIIRYAAVYEPEWLQYNPMVSAIQLGPDQYPWLSPQDPMTYQTSVEWIDPLPMDKLLILNEQQALMAVGLQSKVGGMRALGEKFPDQKLQEVYEEQIEEVKRAAALQLIQAGANQFIMQATGMTPDGQPLVIPGMDGPPDANGNPTGMVPAVDPVLAQEIMSIAFQPSPPERADFNENPGE